MSLSRRFDHRFHAPNLAKNQLVMVVGKSEQVYDSTMTRAHAEQAVEELHARIAVTCGHLNVLHAELASLVGEALDGALWEQGGVRTPEHWLAWQTGLSPARARQFVTIARRRDDLPETLGAFAAGELAVDQVAVVARHTPAHNDAEVCALARVSTVSQLATALSKYVRVEPKHDPEPEPEPEPVTGADPRDQLSAAFDDLGRYHLHLECNAIDGAIVDKALAEARDALFQAGHPNVTAVQAIVEMAKRSLGTIGGLGRLDHFRTYVHLDTDPDGGPGPARAWINGGPQLPASLRDAILCDGVIVPLWLKEGRPINVGRARRTIPAHTRRVVLDRDRTCRHPSCTCSRHLEVHHLQHWIDGGPTDAENLIALCPHHHDAHHRGAFTVTGNPEQLDGLEFFDHRGRPIAGSGRPTPPTGPPPDPASPYRHPLGEPMHTKWLWFTDAPVAGPATC